MRYMKTLFDYFLDDIDFLCWLDTLFIMAGGHKLIKAYTSSALLHFDAMLIS